MNSSWTLVLSGCRGNGVLSLHTLAISCQNMACALKNSNEFKFQWQRSLTGRWSPYKNKKQCSHYRIILHCKTPLHTYQMIHFPDEWSDGIWQLPSVCDEATSYFAGDLNAILFSLFVFFLHIKHCLWLETEHLLEKRRKNLDSTSEFLCNTLTLRCQPA